MQQFLCLIAAEGNFDEEFCFLFLPFLFLVFRFLFYFFRFHSVLVQRFDAFGKPKTAKPCKTCQAMLKGFGVQIARYTTDLGIKEELVKDMR